MKQAMRYPKIEYKKIAALFMLGFILSGCGKEPQLPVTVTVQPGFFKLPAGGEVQFSAQVSGTGNKAVTWQLSGLSGSSISSTGLYKAPLLLPPPNSRTATIRAISQADPNAVGNGAVSITSFKKLPGEAVTSGTEQIAVGGFTVRPGRGIDLNGDDILDLVTMNPTGNSVSIFLGLAKGLFLPKTDVLINKPVALAVADFFNDPSFVADIAVASETDKSVAIISGSKSSASGTFPGTIVGILSLASPPSSMTTGRFHGGEATLNADLAIGMTDGSVMCFLQDRGQTAPPVSFTPATPFQVNGRPIQLAAADFNQDTFLDLAVVREGANDLLVFLGDGAGNFPASKAASFSSPPTALAIADFNNDKIPDLAAAHGGSNQVSVSLGNGDGTFQPAIYTPAGSAPTSITAGDFNLGGNADIAVALPASGAVLLLFGDGTGKLIGNFSFPADAPPLSLISGFFTSFQAPQGAQSVGLIYINPRDGKFDLLNNTSN